MKKYVISFALMTLLCVSAAGFCTYTLHRAEKSENTLKAVYESAVLTTLKHLNDMQYEIRKAQISTDERAGIQFLTSLSADAAGVRHSLSLLPVAHQDMTDIFKFMNQMSDYTRQLASFSQDHLTAGEISVLGQLEETCQALENALTGAKSDWEEKAGHSYQSLGDADVKYPTLLYDGPFSDQKEMAAPEKFQLLPDITQDEALKIARSFTGFPDAREGVSTSGPVPCWGVTVEKGDMTARLAVTKKGGQVLWMFPEHARFDMTLSLQDCKARALSFLSDHGYPHMEPLYFQIYEGLAVINFAPVIDDILFYPDQVKVQIRMDTGETAGFESRGYYIHHDAREEKMLLPSVTEEEAKEQLSDLVYPTRKGRLCVIPKGQKEYLCYEFSAVYEGERYLIYIDAHTLSQREILKIVENPHGLSTF